MEVTNVNRKFLRMTMCLLLVATMLFAHMSASAASSKKVVQILKVTADGARVREGPSSDYDVITSVREGDTVFYLNKNKAAFCYVRTSKGQIGYMYKGFLKAYGAARLDQIYYCTDSNVRVYRRASTGASRVTTLSKYQHVLVYQTRGNWAYIKTMTGKGGFVKLSSLKSAT